MALVNFSLVFYVATLMHMKYCRYGLLAVSSAAFLPLITKHLTTLICNISFTVSGRKLLLFRFTIYSELKHLFLTYFLPYVVL